jgi:hypothetical protein
LRLEKEKKIAKLYDEIQMHKRFMKFEAEKARLCAEKKEKETWIYYMLMILEMFKKFVSRLFKTKSQTI